MRLERAHLVITGTSRGIGRALAARLLAAGARVTALDRDRTRALCGEPGFTRLRADITDERQVRAACGRITAPVHAVILNAGIMRRGTMLTATRRDLEALFAVHVRGTWLVLQHLRPHLAADAVILPIASRHARRLPGDPALYGLTKKWEVEVCRAFLRAVPGLRLKTAFPGPTATRLARQGIPRRAWPRKRRAALRPDDLAALLLRLLTDDRAVSLCYQPSSTRHRLRSSP